MKDEHFLPKKQKENNLYSHRNPAFSVKLLAGPPKVNIDVGGAPLYPISCTKAFEKHPTRKGTES